MNNLPRTACWQQLDSSTLSVSQPSGDLGKYTEKTFVPYSDLGELVKQIKI